MKKLKAILIEEGLKVAGASGLDAFVKSVRGKKVKVNVLRTIEDVPQTRDTFEDGVPVLKYLDPQGGRAQLGDLRPGRYEGVEEGGMHAPVYVTDGRGTWWRIDENYFSDYDEYNDEEVEPKAEML